MNKKGLTQLLFFAVPLLYVFLFGILPLYGISLAFREFSFARGIFSPWNGLDNFRWLYKSEPRFGRVISTTVAVGVGRSVILIIVPVVFVLFLDALPWKQLKIGILFFMLFPQFMSWVVTAGIFRSLFSLDGPVNSFIRFVGVSQNPVSFMTQPGAFLPLLFIAILWRNLGFYSLLLYTALSEVESEVYEAATLDGADPGSLTAAVRIKLPLVKYEILLVASLVFVYFASGAFEAVFNLYNPALYPYVDIIDTYVYRTGIAAGRFSIAAAVDLIKCLMNLVPASLFFQFIYRRMNQGVYQW